MPTPSSSTNTLKPCHPLQGTIPRKRKSYVSVPQGMEVSMCFCADLCRIVKSNDNSDTYGRRIFICDNYEYDPPTDFRWGTNTSKSRSNERSDAGPFRRRCIGTRRSGNERKLKPVKPTWRGSKKGFAAQKLLDPRRYVRENNPDVLGALYLPRHIRVGSIANI
uniref:Uncharacterized protein n=1 Tax=Leersia perrieri TaxID=77586 RepID=A0A0D9XIK7_9ORYZ